MRVLIWLSIGLDRRTPSEHLLIAIVEALIENGHTVHILQKDTKGDKTELPSRMIELGVTTTRINSGQSKRSNLIARYYEDVKYIIKCRKWLKKNKGFDRVFVQSSNVAGIQVYVLRRLLCYCPITFNVQDIFPENAVYSGILSSKGLFYKVLSGIQRYAYKNVDKIITISEDMRDQLVEIGTCKQKIEVIYNWSYQDNPYDPTTIDFSSVAPLFDKQKFNIVYAGNIGRMQNVEILLQTAEMMKSQKDVMFHIFGDGVYREKLEYFAEQSQLNNVIFHSMLPTEQAPAIYSIADINMIPLAKDIYRTALPSKTATCLACNKPIILIIGSKSKFGIGMRDNAGVQLLETDDVYGIDEAIMKIKISGEKHDGTQYYKRYFCKTLNSRKYANIIIGV